MMSDDDHMTDDYDNYFYEHLDTLYHRRKNKLRGPRGTDWYRFKNGVPPRDEFDDWIWNGYRWMIANGPLRECD